MGARHLHGRRGQCDVQDPPPRRVGPSEQVVDTCKAPRICCGNHFTESTLDNGQKVRRCDDRCVNDSDACFL